MGPKCRIRPLGCRISREPFELELPNFIGTSMPTCTTYAPDMTSLSTSGRKLPPKNCRNCCLRWLQVKFLKNSLSKDHQISHGCWGPLVPQICQVKKTSLITSSRLQNAIKYSQKVARKTGLAVFKSKIIRQVFNPDSPNVARTSMPT